MVPEGWLVGKVQDFILLQRGFDITQKDAKSGEVPVYSSSGLAYFHDEVKVKGPGIVTGRKGSVGPVYLVVEDFWPHDTTLWVKDFKGNNVKYIEYFLKFLRLERFDEASSVPTLNRNNVHGVKCVFPPCEEQKKIAQILSTWDKAITTTEQLLANSQQQKKALMQQLLTGKKRLVDKNGVRFSGEWKDIRLKSVLREVKTRNKDNSIHRVLSITNRNGFVLPEEQFSKRVASDNVTNYKVVQKGQYGYNPSRLNIGSFARLDSYDEGLLSPMYVVFSVNEKLLNSDYFINWMGSNEAKQRISGSTQGSVRDSVGFDSLCGFPFKLPPMEEQQKIAAVLSSAEQEISAQQQKLDALKQEKKALMQQLLTGKRRVKINEKEVA